MKPLQATLVPSRRLAGMLAAMHAIAVLPLVLAPGMPDWLRLLLGGGLVASLVHYQLRHGLGRGAAGIDAIHLGADGTFSVRLRQGDFTAAEVQGSSYVAPWLTVLQLRLAGRRRLLPLVLLPDMLPADEFRRLRVWLRWGSRAAEPL